MSCNYLFSAAIDFGTTFSGYAFSSRNDFQISPMNVSCMTWTATSGNLQSLKTSTCVLFNPKGEFDSFGFEAEDKYGELAMDDEHTSWYFFRRFKMMLYKEKNIQRTTQLADESGKKMNALKVFSACIGYLKKHLLKECQRQGFDAIDSDIQWVLTVPAIWNEPAKKFMREAAVQAGIPDSQLMLALEPEAASLFCKHLPVDGLKDTNNKTFGGFQRGTKYMVFDAGGGTIDITVHEVQSHGNLKEIYKANGGEWGGTKVDEEFEALLKDLVCPEVYMKFKKEAIEDLLVMYRSFELKKRTLSKDTTNKVTFTVPMKMRTVYNDRYPQKDMNRNIKGNPKYESDVFWQGDKVRLSAKLTISTFDKCLTKIRGHLQELMLNRTVREVSTFLMVGGFSECLLLQDMLKDLLPGKRIIVPREAGLAVLKGAVIAGHCPDLITERVCRFTYGVACAKPFIPGVHKEEYKVIDGLGVVRCKDSFDVHVAVGDRVKVGEACKAYEYSVFYATDTSIYIQVFAANDRSPMYTTDKTCQKLGQLRIDMSDTSRGNDRGVNVSMTFGGTEIGVEAINKHTQKKQEAFFDFLG